jgi:hypothetical protein
MSAPAPLTRRLLAALESHAREDVGPLALADWAALSSLFDRELALLTRLATAAKEEDAAKHADLRERADALRTRYHHRQHRLARGAQKLQEERSSLNTARQRSREIANAYGAS